MPTIVIASPKGGAGKSTAATILGTELAHAGATVTMLDCDPNKSLSLWAGRGALPPRVGAALCRDRAAKQPHAIRGLDHFKLPVQADGRQ